MRKILLSIATALMATSAIAQTPDEEQMIEQRPEVESEDDVMPASDDEASDTETSDDESDAEAAEEVFEKIFFPYMELQDGGLDWEDLAMDKFYELSRPALWNGPKNPDPEAEEAENPGWIMVDNPHITEYVSLNEYGDMLTWITTEEKMLEQITDSTVARAVKKVSVESVHTVDVSGEFLDIVGTIKGKRQESKNFQIMKYADKLIIYDYNNKILRLLSTEPREKATIIEEEQN